MTLKIFEFFSLFGFSYVFSKGTIYFVPVSSVLCNPNIEFMSGMVNYSPSFVSIMPADDISVGLLPDDYRQTSVSPRLGMVDDIPSEVVYQGSIIYKSEVSF